MDNKDIKLVGSLIGCVLAVFGLAFLSMNYDLGYIEMILSGYGAAFGYLNLLLRAFPNLVPSTIMIFGGIAIFVFTRFFYSKSEGHLQIKTEYYCPKCGKEIDNKTAQFCKYCGARLTKTS